MLILPNKKEVQYKEVPDFPGYRVGDDGSCVSSFARSETFAT